MAARKRAGAEGDFDEEKWLAGAAERYRPAVEEMMSVFDAMPRRADEEQWRAALVEEIVGMLQEGLRSQAARGGDHGAMEADLVRLFAWLQARVRAALAEREGEARAGGAEA
jgi:hypothetical protein